MFLFALLLLQPLWLPGERVRPVPAPRRDRHGRGQRGRGLLRVRHHQGHRDHHGERREMTPLPRRDFQTYKSNKFTFRYMFKLLNLLRS